MGELLTGLQQFLIAVWFFVTYKPLIDAAVEEELTVEETRAQRLKRRWEHSKKQAERHRQKA